MASGNHYVLGYRQAEQERLQRQAEELGHESARLFDEIGIPEGARVLEIGCGPRGCLDLLSARVGASGRVVGVEISADAVALAQTFLTERGPQNVEVIAGDARSTGLPEGSFDLVTSRLILVTIPQPEQIIAEAVALARTGGVVAFHEADRAAAMCDPPSQAWDTVEKLLMAVAEKNGNDFHLGRKLPRLLREAGLVASRQSDHPHRVSGQSAPFPTRALPRQHERTDPGAAPRPGSGASRIEEGPDKASR